MCAFLDWVVQRAALDPDAASCAIIVAMLMLAMVATAVVYFPSVAVYNLLRHRRKKGGRHGEKEEKEADSAGRGRKAA